MPPHRFADRPAQQPPDRGTMDELIAQARRLRGGIDAVRHRTVGAADGPTTDPQRRWQRALCELAAHHLKDLDVQLGQLREGLPTQEQRHARADGAPEDAGSRTEGVTTDRVHTPSRPPEDSLVGRVGSAEWNLLTDAVTWSPELYEIFGRRLEDGPLSLDELPSCLLSTDQSTLTAALTDCLVDGRPIDCELRIVRPDGTARTVHVMGEPVLDEAGDTASMWAVLRDVHELRRSELAVRESGDSLRRAQHLAETERRLAVEFQEAVLPPWRGSLRLSGGGPLALDLAAHYLPSATGTLVGGGWYDALELPDGATLLTVGDLTGHGVTATSGMAMLLGAVRGMAVAGVGPGTLMSHLNQLLDSAAQPALGSALCCRYAPGDHTLEWAQAAHPAPVLFRDGVGRVLPAPRGVLLGATSRADYAQHTERLRAGDVLVLHTEGLLPTTFPPVSAPAGAGGPDRHESDQHGSDQHGSDRPGHATAPDDPAGPSGAVSAAARLLALAPRFSRARTAQECVRAVLEEFGDPDREDDASVLVARVGD